MKSLIVLFLALILTFPAAAQRSNVNSIPFLTPGSVKTIPAGLIEQLIADINDNEVNFRLSEQDLKVLNAHLKYESKDLNDDRAPEFLLTIDHSDWCGAGGNCTRWLYQKANNGYRLLLEDKGLRIGDEFTNGYRNVSSEVPVGFCERNVQRFSVTPYKFDGESYRAEPARNECRAVPQKLRPRKKRPSATRLKTP